MRRLALGLLLSALPPGSADAASWYCGDGSDGPLTVNAPRLEDSVRTILASDASVGSMALGVVNESGFAAGDLVLIIAMKLPTGGVYEFNRLFGTAPSNLQLSKGLSHNFQSVDRVQIIRVREYSYVNVQSGALWGAGGWNPGAGVGGVFVAVSSGPIQVTGGTVTVQGAGYRSGFGGPDSGTGRQGESPTNAAQSNATANLGTGGGGGGGAAGPASGGGGGGYATGGQNGGDGGAPVGTGGASTGTVSLTDFLYMGGGGGGGGGTLSGVGAQGGSGGGIMLLVSCGDIILSGAKVSASGASGTGNGTGASGGGGAGGSILLLSTRTVDLGVGVVASTQGAAGLGTGSDGGEGSVGRIALLNSANKVGSSDPGFSSGSSDQVTFDDPFKAPAAITDLRVASVTVSGLGVSTMAVTLEWTSPSADSSDVNSLLNGFFSLRASQVPIVGQPLYDNANIRLDIPVSGAKAGSLQTATFSVLSSSLSYYFAIRSTDSFQNSSLLSNLGAQTTAYMTRNFMAGGDNWGLDAGDIDNDGDPDILVGDSGVVDRSFVLRNDISVSTFVKVELGGLEAYRGLALGDVDLDGDLDVIASRSTFSPRLLRNDGGLSFMPFDTAGSLDGYAVAMGDADGDGDLDAAVGHGAGVMLLIRHPSGYGSRDLTTTGRIAGVAWGDYDNDGDLDLACAKDGGTDSFILKNDGRGSFTVVGLSDSANARGAAWADYDLDGDLDLALVRDASSADQIWENRGNDTFFLRTLGGAGGDSQGTAWGDADNDGDPDLAVFNSAAQPEFLYRNDGGGSFAQVPLNGSSSNTFGGAWLDADQDGDLDLAVADASGVDETIFRNDISTPNAVPDAPTLGSADYTIEYAATGSTLTFKWPALDYDHRGSTTGLSFIVAAAKSQMTVAGKTITSPSAVGSFVLPWNFGAASLNAVGRSRYQVWPGDGSAKHGVTISSAAAALGESPLVFETTYYFRVQTVDAGLARSAWSGQVSFLLRNPCLPESSNQSGLWSDPNTWTTGNVPNACSAVTIQAGHTVTVDTTTATAGVTTVNGRLFFSRGGSSSLTVVGGDLTVAAGGTLDMGSDGSPIPQGVTAALVLAHGNGPFTYGLIINPEGNFTSSGAVKSPWGYATETVAALATSLKISAADSQGWQTGDAIVIGPGSGSGPLAVDTRTITGVTPLDATTNLVSWSEQLSTARPLDPDSPIVVGNLTRNVVVRSSGTATGGAQANTAYLLSRATHTAGMRHRYSEFRGLGRFQEITDKGGVKVTEPGGNATADFSSCSFNSGASGLIVESSTAVAVRRGVMWGNSEYGFYLKTSAKYTALQDNFVVASASNAFQLDGPSDSVLRRNVAMANGGYGYRQMNGMRNRVYDSTAAHNSQHGFYLGNPAFSGAIVDGGASYKNVGDGVLLASLSQVRIEDMRLSSNTEYGVYAESVANQVRLARLLAHSNGVGGVFADSSNADVLDSTAYGNGSASRGGFQLEASGQWGVNLRSFGNSGKGYWITDLNHVFVDVSAWGNAREGAFLQNVDFSTWAGGALGFGPAGTSANALGDLVYDPSSAFNRLLMQAVRAEDGRISTAAFNKTDTWLLSAQQSFSTGTVRLWGDYSGSFELLYSSRTRSAGATTPRRVIGAAHTASILTVADATAVGQMISIEHRDGQWHVDGSVSGRDLVAPFVGNQPNIVIPNQVSFSFQDSSGVEGDLVEFVLVPALDDANRQKRLLFGPSNASFNSGRSRFGVPSGPGQPANVNLGGAPGFPIIIDRLDSGSTYFIMSSTGNLSISHASVTNMDSDGLQIWGGNLSLSTMTFDSAGVTNATSAYISYLANFPAGTFDYYGVEFGLSRSTPPGTFLFNVMVKDGIGGGGSVTFRKSSGTLAGDGFDYDTSNPTPKIRWAPLTLKAPPPPEPPVDGSDSVIEASSDSQRLVYSILPALAGVNNDAGARFEITLSSRPDFQAGTVRSSTTFSTFTALVAGLEPNTLYFARVRAIDGVLSSSYTLLNGTPTLANAPSILATTFVAVYPSSVAAAWESMPLTPATASASGYQLEASSVADFTGQVLSTLSSGTFALAQSTLTVGADGGPTPPALFSNTTYYFRVGSLNDAAAKNYRGLGSTSSLSKAVTFAPSAMEVYASSASLRWNAPSAAACAVQADCNEGYSLEASSTAFGALGPGGLLLSSKTANPFVDRLAVAGLDPFTTYYFRLGALNWNGAPNYDAVVSTFVNPLKPVLVVGSGGASVGAAWGDYDGDGDLDAVTGNGGAENEIILRNIAGVLSPTASPASGGDSRGVAWGDYDNDGDLDVLVANAGSAEGEKLLRNDGGGLFTVVSLGASGGTSFGVAWGDVDGDGDLDALVANSGTEDEVLLRNTAGTFAVEVLSGTGGDSRGVAWADYDSDGDLDALVGNAGGGDEYLLRNDGGNLIKVNLPGTGGDSSAVAWGDYDGDGDPDALVVNFNEDSYLLRNDAGTLTKVALSGTALPSVGGAWADFDNDGDLDIMLTQAGGSDEVLLRNEGGGVFTKFQLNGSGGESSGGSWGDADGDGDLDFLVSNRILAGSSDEVLLRNDLALSISAPAPPSSGFDASFTEFATFSSSGVATMLFGPGNDGAQTPAAALDYLLRVGTTISGSSEALKVPNRYGLDAYSGGGSSLYSTRLPAGQRGLKIALTKETTAYWAVTAVDGMLQRSVPSAEQSFGLAAPRAVTDLAVAARVTTGLSASTMSVTLTWTAPGADGSAGAMTALTPGSYDLRWATFPLTSTGAYVSAAAPNRLFFTTTTAAAGERQAHIINTLDAAVTWYFAITTLDSTGGAGVRSQLSNQTTALAILEAPPTSAKAGGGVAWGDFDKDGDLDAVVSRTGAGTEEIGLLTNNAGVFSYSSVNGNSGLTGTSASFVDLDADGDLDLAASFGGTGKGIATYRNNGGSFAPSFYGTGVELLDLAWADVDHDGDLDGVAATAVGDAILARNNGDGTLTTSPLAGTGGSNTALAWGDCDSDGQMDLAVAKAGGQQGLWRNQGGVFSVGSLPDAAGQGRGVAWGDYDRDGDLDLAFSFDDVEARLLTNNGACSFTGSNLTVGGAGLAGRRLAWADVDSDGDLDLVLARNSAGGSKLLRNDGAGGFAVASIRGTEGAMSQAVPGDFDGDGDLDLLFVSETPGADVFVRNLSTTVNTVPARPAALNPAELHLAYDATGSTLTVKWPGADYDGPGSSGSLQYALVVATSAMSLGALDERIVTNPSVFAAAPGDASPLMGHFLRPAFTVWPGDSTPKHGVMFRLDTPGGRLASDTTYFIRLQAIDGGLARSSWSLELSTNVFVPVPVQGRSVVAAGPTFVTVGFSTVTGQTRVVVDASTSPVFATLTASVEAPPIQNSATLLGLGVNTTYYLRVGGLYRSATTYAAAVPPSTTTLANAPVSDVSTFTFVSTGMLTMVWGANGNPLGTQYQVLLATTMPFTSAVVDVTTRPFGPLQLSAGSLFSNTTHFLIVRSYNHNGVFGGEAVLGSTVTRIETPESVYLDHVGSRTIVVSGFLSGAGFRNLHAGRSGISHSKNGGTDYDPPEASFWRSTTAAPAARQGFAYLVDQNNVYAIGGEGLASNDVFELERAQWPAGRAPLPAGARGYFGAAASGGFFYLMGGFEGGFKTLNERYDPAADSWTTLLPMSSGRRKMAAVAVDGKVHLFGGDDIFGAELATHESYEIASDTWTTRQPMPTARTSAAAVLVGTRVFVVGGEDTSGVPVAANEEYLWQTDTWASRAPMPTPRGRAAVAAAGGKLYVFGGRDGISDSGVVEVYDPARNTWARLEPMPTARSLAAAAESGGGTILVLGGNAGAGALTTHEEYATGAMHRFNNLTPNTFYTFRAKARNQLGIDSGNQSPNLSAVTLAAVPASAADSFPSFGPSSMTLQWGLNLNPGGTFFRAQLSAAADFSGQLFASDWEAGVSTQIRGLVPNTTYFGRVQARNGVNVETAFLSLGSSVTFPAVPAPDPAPLTGVTTSSMTAAWSAAGNPAGTIFHAVLGQAESEPDDSTDERFVATTPFAAPGAGFTSLAGNATYYLYVRAVGHRGALSPWALLGSSATLPNTPLAASAPFSSISSTSLTVAWSPAGNADGTLYSVAATTVPGAFPNAASGNVVSSTRAFPTAAALSVLASNATYFLHVAAVSHSGGLTAYTALGSTATRPAVPQTAVSTFSAVAAQSLTAAWDAAGNAPGTEFEAVLSTSASFTAADTANRSASTAPQGGPSAALSSLFANTTYYLLVRAVAYDGERTSFTALGATVTLAFAPLADSIPDVFVSSLSAVWGANGNPLGSTLYEAAVSTDPVFPNSLANTVGVSTRPPGAPGADFPGLIANTTYYLFARSLNHGGSPSAMVPMGSTVTRVNDPSGAVYASVQAGSMTVEWSANTNPAGTRYDLTASTDANFTGSSDIPLSTAPQGSPSAVIDGLLSNTTYYVRVVAVNHGLVPASTPLVFTATATLAAVPTPAAEAFLSAGETSLTVAWSRNGNAAGTTLYELHAATSSDFSDDGAVGSTVAAAAPSLALNGLTANTTYYVRVRAVNHNGLPSPILVLGSTATLAAAPGVGGTPLLYVGVSSASVQWATGGNPDGITRYRVVFSPAPGAAVSFSTVPAQSPPTALVSGLEPNTTYSVSVAAENHSGLSSVFTVLPATATQAAQPATVAETFTAVTRTAMTAFWSGAGNSSGTLYEAVLNPGNVSVSTAPEGAPQADFTDLDSNTTYYLFVRAISRGGASTPYSALGSTATLPNDPMAAGTTYLAVERSSATLQWSANGNSPGTVYRVFMATATIVPNAASGTVQLSTRPFGPPGIVLTGLLANATYNAFVAALSHGGGETAYVALASTVTLASAPAPGAGVSGTTTTAFAVSWDANGNIGGTRYEVVASTVAGVPDGSPDERVVSTSPELGPGAGFTGLLSNATYFLFARTLSRSNVPSAYAALGSTATRPSDPALASLAFTALASSTLSAAWSGSGNTAGTRYDAVLSTGAGFPNLFSGNVELSTAPEGAVGADFADLSADTTYQLFVRAVGRDGAPTAYALSGTTVTLAAPPELSLATFPVRNTNAVSFQWSANGNPAGTRYVAELSGNPGFSPIDRSSTTVDTKVRFGRRGEGTDLPFGTPYFFRVRALNRAGSPTAFTAAVTTSTLASDDVKPTMSVNAAGDTRWRRANTGLYDVDFADQGGSELLRFRVTASLVPGGGGPSLAGPTDVPPDINDESFTTDWALPGSVFTAMIEGATNYVTVEAFDSAANSTAVVDAFFVRKDTTAPSFIVDVPGETSPRRASPAFNVDARDAASGLERFQYSASLAAGLADQAVLPWTDIPLAAGTTAFTADWALDFDSLVDGTTNFISIRAWDLAGTTNTRVDAFRVIKDTTPPTVAVSVPASAFRSSLGLVSGTAFDAVGMQGVEAAFQETGTGLFWSGADFDSGPHVFFTASGTGTWTLPPGIAFVDGEAYKVVARASDTAGSFSPVYSTSSFTLDASSPTGRVLVPADGAAIAVLPAVSGTAADPLPQSGITAGLSSVQLKLRRISDGKYWDFFNDAFGTTPVSTGAAGALTSWTAATSPRLRASLAHGASYQLTINTIDGAVPPNTEPFEVRSNTFTWQDLTPPAAVANLAATFGSGPGEVILNWSATGDDGAAGQLLSAEFRIHHASFAAAAFSTTAAQVARTSGPVNPGDIQLVIVNGLTPGDTYFFAVFTADNDGNWSAVSNVASSFALQSPQQKISGHVVKTSSEGVTAVKVEAFDANGARVATAFTLADGSGTYILDSVPGGVYKVEATWTAGEVASSVWIDNVTMGAVNVDFVLEINYTLSTLTGTLASLSAQSSGPAGFLARAAGNDYRDSRVELLRGGAQVAAARPDPTGRWSIANLLPGKYAVRAYNGLEYTEAQEVELGEGETHEVLFVFDPLPAEQVFAFPNPARSRTTFRFVSGLPGLEAQVQVFDIAGTLVKELPGSSFNSPSPGLYHAVWDLTNDDGESVASGVYLFMTKVKGNNGQNGKVIKKLAVVR
ncbi:MAG: VCBS repeat-containing protein [Elusimicrobia bacterium]|nr:VCBS repeat-containing protein [Elusimicrobiota bacterium]